MKKVWLVVALFSLLVANVAVVMVRATAAAPSEDRPTMLTVDAKLNAIMAELGNPGYGLSALSANDSDLNAKLDALISATDNIHKTMVHMESFYGLGEITKTYPNIRHVSLTIQGYAIFSGDSIHLDVKVGGATLLQKSWEGPGTAFTEVIQFDADEWELWETAGDPGGRVSYLYTATVTYSEP